ECHGGPEMAVGVIVTQARVWCAHPSAPLWPKELMQAAGVPCGWRATPTHELAMTSTTILAIDLGKYKCVSCAYDRPTAGAEFRTVTTSRAEVQRLIRDARPAVVVIEACALA